MNCNKCGKCCFIGMYWCKHYDLENKKCKIYNKRPQLCRDYYCPKARMNSNNKVQNNGIKIK